MILAILSECIMLSFVNENIVTYSSSRLVSNKKFIFKIQILSLEIGKIDHQN